MGEEEKGGIGKEDEEKEEGEAGGLPYSLNGSSQPAQKPGFTAFVAFAFALASASTTSNLTPFLWPLPRSNIAVLTSPRKTLATPSQILSCTSYSLNILPNPSLRPSISKPKGIRLTSLSGSIDVPTSSKRPRMKRGLFME